MLVRFEPGVSYDIEDDLAMQDELQALFGRTVDLVERSSVEKSPNYIRRKHILGSLEPIYVAG